MKKNSITVGIPFYEKTIPEELILSIDSILDQTLMADEIHLIQDGMVNVELENIDLGISVRLAYKKSQLPTLYQWKMMREGAYVTGIEPANTEGIMGRVDARNHDNLPHLEPGESKAYSLDFSIIDKG